MSGQENHDSGKVDKEYATQLRAKAASQQTYKK